MPGTGEMHPSNDELAVFARARSRESAGFQTVRNHLESCENCRAKVTEIELWDKEVEASMAEGLPPAARTLADRTFAQAIAAARTIELIPLPMPHTHEPVHLAADGHMDTGPSQSLEHRATLISENPELVLRIMYDPRRGEESVHLIAPDPAATRHVLIHADDPPVDVVTDDEGKSVLREEWTGNMAAARWEIRLPDATFALTPLEEMGTDARNEQEVTLKTGPDNELGITFTEGPEGLALRLRLLRVNGRDNVQRARLVISQRNLGDRVVESTLNAPCVISGLSAAQPIDIRIFAL